MQYGSFKHHTLSTPGWLYFYPNELANFLKVSVLIHGLPMLENEVRQKRWTERYCFVALLAVAGCIVGAFFSTRIWTSGRLPGAVLGATRASTAADTAKATSVANAPAGSLGGYDAGAAQLQLLGGRVQPSTLLGS